MRRHAPLVASSLCTLAACLAAACSSSSSGGQPPCLSSTSNPVAFVWPCDLVLESFKVTGGCAPMGVTLGAEGASLLVGGAGNGGACDVTLVFTSGLTYSKSLQATPDTGANGCIQFTLQPPGPFQVAPPCGADGGTTD